jgi:hypothetical protein
VSYHVAVLTMHCAEPASGFRAGSKEETHEAV